MSPDPARLDRPISLAVLLVHGMGEQHRGDTLLAWLDAIVGTIEAATRNRVSADVEWAELGQRSDASGGTPAHATIRIRGDGIDERWLAVEAWWAQTFTAPSFAQLVTWSFRAIPWTIAMHAAQRYWRLAGTPAGPLRALARGWAAAQVLGTLFLAPFIVLALALLLLVGLIPIASVRTTVGRIQRALAATVGDSMVFLESPVTAAAVCTEVLGAFAWLKRACGPTGCGRTVILAHSQGATVTLEALRRIESPEPAEASPAGERPVLVTFGAGINKLAVLRWFGSARGASDPEREDADAAWLTRDPIRVTCVCLLGAAAVAAWFWRLIATGQITTRQLWLVPAAWLGGSLLLGLAVAGGQRLVAWRPWLKKVAIGTVMSLFLGGLVGGIVIAETRGIQVMPFALLVMIVLIMGAAISLTLSPTVQEGIVRSIPIPTNVERWLDYWASADPVPNGSTRTRTTNLPVSRRIWNEASALSDHTAYWQNRDGFVLPVVRILAETARSAWTTLLPPESADATARSRWRTGWLRAARWAAPLAGLLVGLRKGPELEAMRLEVMGAGDVLGIAGWLTWVPASSWTLAFRWGVVAAASWAAYRILLAAWHAWVRAEQEQSLRQRAAARIAFGLRLYGFAVTLVIVAGFTLARTEWVSARSAWQRVDLGDLAITLAVIGIWSQALVWLGARIFPPPPAAAPARREAGAGGVGSAG